MKPLTVTNAAKLATILDAIADVEITDTIADHAVECVTTAIAEGWDIAGAPYTIEAMPGDVQILGDLLDRAPTAQERRMLEACIRVRFANERGE